MTKDEFIEEYSRFGHRTDARYESSHAGLPFSRWNLDKVHEHFDAVPCDCGHQECKGWKMRAKSMDPPEDCSVDPMTLFGPLGPPFTMLDPEEPAITFTSSDDAWKRLADVTPEWGQLVEYRAENWRKEPDKTYSAIDETPRQGKFVPDCGTNWNEQLDGFTTEKLGVIIAPDPEITFWRAVPTTPTFSARSEDRDTVRGSGDDAEPFMSGDSGPISPGVAPTFKFGPPDTGLAMPDEFNMCFIQDGKTIGKLKFNEKTEKLDFSGDVHESAQIFFDLITERFEAWHKEKYGE